MTDTDVDACVACPGGGNTCAERIVSASGFAHKQLKHILDHTFGFMFIIS
jgi:hypothetical protein